MVNDINRLHIELDYGEVVNFDNRYFTLSATEENFKKHNKLLIGSYIALPVYLLKYLGEDLNTAEEFLKFPLIKKPKKIIADTTVLPEKKPGTRKHNSMNKANKRRNPVTAIQLREINSQNKLLLAVSSFASLCSELSFFSDNLYDHLMEK